MTTPPIGTQSAHPARATAGSAPRITTPTMKRFLVLFVGAAFFFAFSTFNRPRTSSADTARNIVTNPRQITPGVPLASVAGRPAAPAFDEQGRGLIGSLSGRGLHVWIYSSAGGPLYSVVNDKGDMLGHGLTTQEVYERFPDLNIHELHFTGDPKQIMIVDPRD